MVVEKTNTMEAKENFKGLPKCYVKTNIGQFIKQWVTPELYPELLEQTQTAQIPSLREKKDHLYFQCIYYEGKWSSKLKLFNHRFKGCEFGLIHTYTKN
jgi:hypothetical protein